MNDREKQITENLDRYRMQIGKAAIESGRKPGDITLLAVSKTMPVSDIIIAMNHGQLAFGENRPQELVRKIDEIQGKNLQWHLIGQLQKNKVKYIIKKGIFVHSLGTYSTLAELERQGGINDCSTDVLIEVNTSGEESKSGVSPEEVEEFISSAIKCEHVNIRGFMTIAPYGTDAESARPYFAKLRSISEKYSSCCKTDISRSGKPILSMGMTGDYLSAIKEGADIVRIGTGIFGNRIYI